MQPSGEEATLFSVIRNRACVHANEIKRWVVGVSVAFEAGGKDGDVTSYVNTLKKRSATFFGC